MMNDITPLIITYNEAPNIGRTLKKLTWARKILVIDSGSTDATLDIARACPQVEIVHHRFMDFASQCNFGLTRVASNWVLSLDADYELSDELVRELFNLVPSNCIAGYQVRFVYRIYGRPLRGTLYPPRIVLYRTSTAIYENQGHGHKVKVKGDVVTLNGVIYHDDQKPLARWLTSQQRYARDEAQSLLNSPRRSLAIGDRVRLVGLAPIIVLLYTLVAKGCIFDGWPGWYYALQRVIAESLILLEIVDRRLRKMSES
jgi:glycosyltransferase involved in cell wall biosynthesis